MFSNSIFGIIVIFAALSFIISALVWRLARSKKRYFLNQQQSLVTNTALKVLIDNLQQHRGMLNATLSGDNSFSTKITQTQKLINSTLNELNTAIKNTALDSHLDHLNKIQQSWNKLYPTALSLSKMDSLKKHTAIVQSALFLMSNIAEENQLLKDNCYPVELVDIVWHCIPNTAEALGKTRAAGSGIAATGTCGAIDHIKVGFLIKHINDTIAIVDDGLKKLQHQSNDYHKLFTSYKVIQSDIRDLLDTLKKKILEPTSPQITAGAFFEQATGCLGKVYGFFDQSESMVKNKVDAALVKTEGTLNTSLTIMVVSFLAIVVSSFVG